MMTERRFARLIAAHGADPARWPEAERAAGIAWADGRPDARAALDAERRLDALLDLAAPPPLPDSAGSALADRIMATLDSRALPADLPGAGNLPLPMPPARPPLRLFATLGAAAAVALVGLGLLLGRSVSLSQPATAEADQMLLLGGPALTAGFSS